MIDTKLYKVKTTTCSQEEPDKEYILNLSDEQIRLLHWLDEHKCFSMTTILKVEEAKIEEV